MEKKKSGTKGVGVLLLFFCFVFFQNHWEALYLLRLVLSLLIMEAKISVAFFMSDKRQYSLSARKKERKKKGEKKRY